MSKAKFPMEEELGKRDKAQRFQELDDIKQMMKDPRGRRVIWRFIAMGRVFHSCYTGTAETYYREGKRDTSLEIFQDVISASDREDFWKMQDENSDLMRIYAELREKEFAFGEEKEDE